MKRKQISWGSIFTGGLLGIIAGLYLTELMPLFQYSNIIYYVIPILLLSYLGYKKPIFTEYFAYAVAVYILFQFAWDYIVGDRGSIRMRFFISAIISLTLNILTGKIKFIGAKKTAKRAIGLGK